MSQYFTVINIHKPSDNTKSFMWSEEENGYEKYGFLYADSVLNCLEQIEKEIDDNEFEIYINVGDKNGSSLIKTLEQLATAKVKYNSIN